MYNINTFPRVLLFDKKRGVEPRTYDKALGMKFQPLYNWLKKLIEKWILENDETVFIYMLIINTFTKQHSESRLPSFSEEMSVRVLQNYCLAGVRDSALRQIVLGLAVFSQCQTSSITDNWSDLQSRRLGKYWVTQISWVTHVGIKASHGNTGESMRGQKSSSKILRSREEEKCVQIFCSSVLSVYVWPCSGCSWTGLHNTTTAGKWHCSLARSAGRGGPAVLQLWFTRRNL